MANFTFPKKYKLSTSYSIQNLFNSNESFYSYPFVLRYIHQVHKDNASFKVLFLVSKKSFKKSHDRNRIKRVMRELFRLNLLIIESKFKEKFPLSISIQYIGKEKKISYNQLHISFIKLLESINK